MEHTVSLKKNYEFRRLYQKGASAASPRIVVYCRRGRGDRCRLGLTVGNKIGKAVVRNRIRRRLREIYRLEEGRLTRGYDIVIVARAKAREADFHELRADFLKLAGKLGLIREA